MIQTLKTINESEEYSVAVGCVLLENESSLGSYVEQKSNQPVLESYRCSTALASRC